MVCRHKKTCVYIRCPVFVYGWKKVDGLFLWMDFNELYASDAFFHWKYLPFALLFVSRSFFAMMIQRLYTPATWCLNVLFTDGYSGLFTTFFVRCFIRALEPMKKYRGKKMAGDWHIFNRIPKHTSIFQVQQKRKPTVIGWIEVNVGLSFFCSQILVSAFFSILTFVNVTFCERIVRTITTNFTFNSREKRSNAIEKRHTVYFKT